MANTIYSISVDFKKANNQAEKLEQLANKILKQRTKLSEEKQTILSNWNGSSSTAYARKISAIESELKDIESSLRKTANTIKSVAVNTYNAEKQAILLAQNEGK